MRKRSTTPAPDATPETDQDVVATDVPQDAPTPDGDDQVQASAATQDAPTEPQQDAPTPAPEPTPVPEPTPAPEPEPAVVIVPTTPAQPVRPPSFPSTSISVRSYIEERPRLTREARDILMRLHATQRKTRDEWDKLAQTYGGHR